MCEGDNICARYSIETRNRVSKERVIAILMSVSVSEPPRVPDERFPDLFF